MVALSMHCAAAIPHAATAAPAPAAAAATAATIAAAVASIAAIAEAAARRLHTAKSNERANSAEQPPGGLGVAVQDAVAGQVTQRRC